MMIGPKMESPEVAEAFGAFDYIAELAVKTE